MSRPAVNPGNEDVCTNWNEPIFPSLHHRKEGWLCH